MFRDAFYRFRRDEHGHMAMEFVLWMGFILVPWFVVSAVLYDTYRTLDLATKTSYTLADLISRQTVLQDESADSPDLADIIVLQRALLPRAAEDMSLRISSIKCVRTGGCLDTGSGYTPAVEDFQVIWSVVPSRSEWPVDFEPPVPLETGATDGTPEAVPVGLIPRMAELDTVLLVDVTVSHQPFSSLLDFQRQTWNFRVPIRPRFVPEVQLVTSETSVYFDPSS